MQVVINLESILLISDVDVIAVTSKGRKLSSCVDRKCVA